MKKLEFRTFYFPGYGGPSGHECSVVFDNKKLESFTVYSDYELGKREVLVMKKWEDLMSQDNSKFLELLDKAKLASALCAKCNTPTGDVKPYWECYVGNDVLCYNCSEK